MSFQEFTTPDFLLCENPVKTNESNRLWVYAVKYLSLIEVIHADDILISNITVKNKKFQYTNSDGVVETYILAFTQNNIQAVSDATEDEVLEMAFSFLTNYLRWEDGNIDIAENAGLN